MSCSEESQIIVNLNGNEYLVTYRQPLFYGVDVVGVVSAMGFDLPIEDYFTFEAAVELILEEDEIAI